MANHGLTVLPEKELRQLKEDKKLRTSRQTN